MAALVDNMVDNQFMAQRLWVAQERMKRGSASPEDRILLQQAAQQQRLAEFSQLRSDVNAAIPQPTDAEVRQRAGNILKGAAIAPFTIAPDVIGLISMMANRTPGSPLKPIMSGDPIRELVFGNATDPYGMAGEMFSPIATGAKVATGIAKYGTPALATALYTATQIAKGGKETALAKMFPSMRGGAKGEETILGKYFSSRAIDEAKGFTSGNSKQFVVEMTPRQFLSMAERTEGEASKKELIAGLIESGTKFDSLPMLQGQLRTYDGKTMLVLNGHEGRHRAMALIEQGFGDKPMPVRVNQIEGGDVPVIRTYEGNGIDGMISENDSFDLFKDSDISHIMINPQPMPKVTQLSVVPEIPQPESLKVGEAELYLSGEDIQGRQRRLANRDPEVGLQKNERRILDNGTGNPIAVGRITTQDWIDRVGMHLTPQEVQETRKWYANAKAVFDEAFGPERSELMLASWLLANKNESPSGALRNALRIAEQIDSSFSTAKLKGGLSDDVVRQLMAGDRIESGVGRKLFDFMDAEAGRNTRTYYGHAPEAGEPFVVDIWSYRDAGYIDNVLMNHLNKNGYDTTGLVVDNAAGPTNTQYERAAQQFRDRTDQLNAMGWEGGNLRPAEVQAIGWASMQKTMGKTPEMVDDIILKNTRRVAYELAPGRMSEHNRLFGERLYNLPVEEQAAVADQVLTRIDEYASDLLGIQSSRLIHGSGGWRLYDPQPNTVAHLLSSPETAELYANVVGYLGQQESVWIAKTKNFTAQPNGYGIVLTGQNLGDDKTVRTLWTALQDVDETGKAATPFRSRAYNERARAYREKNKLGPNAKLPDDIHQQYMAEAEADSKLLQGYMPVVTPDGTPGIMVLIDRGGKTTFDQIENSLRRTIEDVVANGPVDDIEMSILEAEVIKAGNPTGNRFSGQTYLQRIKELGRGDIVSRLRADRGQFTQDFDAALTQAEARVQPQKPVRSIDARAPAAPEAVGADVLQRFDNELKATAPKKIGKPVTLVHFGKTPGREVMDVSYSGGGIRGGEEARKAAFPDTYENRIYYYTNMDRPGGPRKEAGLGHHRYETSLDQGEIYDMAADPLNLRKQIPSNVPDGLYMNLYEQAIKKAGYSAYRVNDVVAVFKTLPVRQVR